MKRTLSLFFSLILLIGCASVFTLAVHGADPLRAEAFLVNDGGETTYLFVVFSDKITDASTGTLYNRYVNGELITNELTTYEKVSDNTLKYTIMGPTSYIIPWNFTSVSGTLHYVASPTTGSGTLALSESVTFRGGITGWAEVAKDCYSVPYTVVTSASDVPSELAEPEPEPEDLEAVAYLVDGDANSVYVVFSHAVPTDKAGFVWITGDAGTFNADQVTQISAKVVKYTSKYDILATAGSGVKIGFHKDWGEPEITEAKFKTFDSVSMWGSPHDLHVIAFTSVSSAKKVPSEIPAGGVTPEPDPEPVTPPSETLSAVAYTVKNDRKIYLAFSEAVTLKNNTSAVLAPAGILTELAVAVNDSVLAVDNTDERFNLADILKTGWDYNPQGLYVWDDGVVGESGAVLPHNDETTVWGEGRTLYHFVYQGEVDSVDEIPSHASSGGSNPGSGSGPSKPAGPLTAKVYTLEGDSRLYVVFNKKVKLDADNPTSMVLAPAGILTEAAVQINDYTIAVDNSDERFNLAEILKNGWDYTPQTACFWGNYVSAANGEKLAEDATVTVWGEEKTLAALTYGGEYDSLGNVPTGDNTVLWIGTAAIVSLIGAGLVLTKKKKAIR